MVNSQRWIGWESRTSSRMNHVFKEGASLRRIAACWRFWAVMWLAGFNESCLPHPSLQRCLSQCTIHWEKEIIAKNTPSKRIHSPQLGIQRAPSVGNPSLSLWCRIYLHVSKCTWSKKDSRRIQSVAWQRTRTAITGKISTESLAFASAVERTVSPLASKQSLRMWGEIQITVTEKTAKGLVWFGQAEKSDQSP